MDKERRYSHARTEDLEETGRRPSPILIVAVVAVLIIFVGVLVYVFVGERGISSVAVGNVSKDVGGISFPIYTSAKGFGEFDGDVDIEIFYEGTDDPVYEGKASISGDSGSHQVDYEDFVWGNGDYEVHASSDGVGDFVNIRIDSVIDRIVPEWGGQNSDQSRSEPDYNVDITIGYLFGTRTSPQSEDPQIYSFLGTVTTPDGRTITIDSNDYPSNLLKITRSIDHQEKGEYVLSGEVTNEFCHPDSPFKTISVEAGAAFSFDANPFAVAGEDISTTLSGGEATVVFDGSDSWDDSSIVRYIWYIGDDDEVTSSSPISSYTFSETGTYYISLDVIDDGGNHSDQNAELSTFAVNIE